MMKIFGIIITTDNSIHDLRTRISFIENRKEELYNRCMNFNAQIRELESQARMKDVNFADISRTLDEYKIGNARLNGENDALKAEVRALKTHIENLSVENGIKEKIISELRREGIR